MICNSEYTHRERIGLWVLAGFGFTVINTVFLYGIFFHQNTITATLQNPIALAFIIETFLLLGVFTYLLSKWQVLKLHWSWFVFLSMLGSMAFALPVVLLWRWNRNKDT